MESHVDSDNLAAIDLFTQAIRLAKEEGIGPWRTLEKLQKRATSERYALTDSIHLTKLLSHEPAGFIRWALYLIKKGGDNLDALDLLIKADKLVGPKPTDTSSSEFLRWTKIHEITGHYMESLKLKTGYNRRKDPCKVFPLEVLNEIFSHLNIKAWLTLQIVSKSWRNYLTNNPYLWASSIDFSCFEKRKCNEATLKQCLDFAFLKTSSPLSFNQVPTIQYLRIGPFSTPASEINCINMLCKDNFIYQGKAIDELSIEFRKLPRGQDLSDNHPIYNLVPTKKLSLSTGHPTNLGSVYLDTILLNQKDTLEELHLSCRKVISKYDGLVTDVPFDRAKYPLLKVLRLKAADMSELSYLNFFDCPNLQMLNLSLSTYFDIEWFCKAPLPFLNLFNVSFSKEHSRHGRVAFGGLYHPLHMPPQYVSEWPRSLTSLTLCGVEWFFLQSVSGSLEGLEVLDLGHSKITIGEFFDRFNCGKKIRKLILEYTSLADNEVGIWEKCPNIKQLSLFKTSNVDTAQIDGIVSYCKKLEEIDVGRTTASEELILRLTEVVKIIGCKSIKFNPGAYERLSSSGVIISMDPIDMN